MQGNLKFVMNTRSTISGRVGNVARHAHGLDGDELRAGYTLWFHCVCVWAVYGFERFLG